MTANVEPSPIQTILVIDDNEANRALARDTLEDEGYLVILASGGEEGVALFERERPECLLLDVRMPGLWTVLPFASAFGTFPGTPRRRSSSLPR